VRAIHPACRVTPVPEFFTAASAETILSPHFDCVVDAIDHVGNKCLLLALCRAKSLPVVCCGAAGGRRDAMKVRVADLSLASHDRLLAEVRRRLRSEHGFSRGAEPFGVDTVFSTELPVFPQPDGTVCAARSRKESEEGLRLNCDTGFGSATFVTGVFGFAAAGEVVRKITELSRQ
jgi:tRNA A37 threonylcarbamoyladenosine dehydratase